MTAPTLTDLETRLAAPDGSALRDALLARAARLDTTLRTRLADGLPRADFPDWQAAADAVAAAQAVLSAWPVPASTPADDSAGPATR